MRSSSTLKTLLLPEEKASARQTLQQELATGGYGARYKIVRVNGLDTSWGLEDARALADMDADCVLLPKVSSPDMLDALAALTDKPLWAMMETPLGMLNAAQIAAHGKLEGMVMGTNDLAKDLQSRFRSDRAPLLASLGLCVLAARAHGIAIVDGVYNAFKDEEGLAQECEDGRDMGFDGKTLIHPAQIETTNRIFSPTDDDIALAQRQIAAFEAAEAAGQGVAVVDGRIVENLHIVTAKELLAKAEAIAELEG